MSAPSTTDQPRPAPSWSGRAAKGIAVVAAVAALAFGANAITSHSSSASSATSGPGGAAPAGQNGMPPQMGTAVTGTTLAKLKAAALAKYPGTVERAMKLPDGSYEVHVIQSGDKEVHVLVSKAFKVTGVRQGGPPGAAPSGSSSSSS